MQRYISLLVIVIALLAVGCRATTPEATPTATSAPQTQEVVEATLLPRPTLLPTATQPPTAAPTPTPMPEPTETPIPEPTATPLPTETPEPTAVPSTAPPAAAPPARSTVVAYDALTLLPDTDPAPPLSLSVSANRALEGDRYLVTGWMRNDSDQTYSGLAVVATFFFESGRRYNPIREMLPCSLLEPGQTCPFVVTANARDLAEVLLHPEGRPTDRQSVPVTLSGLSRYADPVGYVHLTGNVTNPNAFAIRDVGLTGTLLDSRGELVSAGILMLPDTLEPGKSVAFDLPLYWRAYSTYTIEARAELR